MQLCSDEELRFNLVLLLQCERKRARLCAPYLCLGHLDQCLLVQNHLDQPLQAQFHSLQDHLAQNYQIHPVQVLLLYLPVLLQTLLSLLHDHHSQLLEGNMKERQTSGL